jgi:aspartate aminotransferase-like enzyme
VVLSAAGQTDECATPKISKRFFRRTAEKKVRNCFYTCIEFFQGTSSGSGMQEAGYPKFVQEQVLSCVNGAFADRWYKCCHCQWETGDKIEVPWGEAITPNAGRCLKNEILRSHYHCSQ